MIYSVAYCSLTFQIIQYQLFVFFYDQSTNTVSTLISSCAPRSYLMRNFANSMFFQSVTQSEIMEIVNSLRPGTAAGHDKIPMWAVKNSINFISEPPTHIINLSVQSGIVPDQMKIARVIPLFKSGVNSLFSNYRPISVLPIFSKTLEKVVYNRLFNYLNKHSILSDNQFGFRKNHSTSLALVHLLDMITAAIDQKKLLLQSFLICPRLYSKS